MSPGTPTNVYFSVTGGGPTEHHAGRGHHHQQPDLHRRRRRAAHAVTIGGANTLTIAGSGGITVANGSGAHVISTYAVSLGTNQTWTNNSANAFTVSAPLSGANLTIAGTGTVVFTNGAASTYGTTTINAGSVLQLGNNSASGTPGSGAVVDNGTLVLARTGAALGLGNLSGSGTLVLGAGATLAGPGAYAANGSFGTLALPALSTTAAARSGWPSPTARPTATT